MTDAAEGDPTAPHDQSTALDEAVHDETSEDGAGEDGAGEDGAGDDGAGDDGAGDDGAVVAGLWDAIHRSDEIAKAAPGAADPARVRDRARASLEAVRDDIDAHRATLSAAVVHDLSVQVSRRMLDLDGADLAAKSERPQGVPAAPTRGVDAARVPPDQHLTAGFPVLHVGSPPAPREDWTVTIAGHVQHRLVLDLDDLRSRAVDVTADFHCVTTWSRLDTAWRGVPVRQLLELAQPRASASHALVYGHPAYSANFTRADLEADDVVLAFQLHGAPLPAAHGGPLRLVVPHLYGWKSVKWVTEIRLVDREVPGYWEERGYHLRGDPWHAERFRRHP